MGLPETVALRARRALAAASCFGLLAVGALAAGVSLAASSPLRSGTAGIRFDPQSVTFVSVDSGWVLGTVPCAGGACLALRETTDAGRSWSARPLPATLVAAADRKLGALRASLDGTSELNVRFADLRDGWIYGGLAVPTRAAGVASASIEPTLWSTKDGGLTWRKEPLRSLGPDTSIFDLEAAAGMVYVIAANNTSHATVESSTVAAATWHLSRAVPLGLPAGGAQPSGAIVLQGSSGWLVEGNGRGTSGSARLDGNGGPGGIHNQKPRCGVRDGGLRLPPFPERPPRGDHRVELALSLEQRREDL